MGSETSTPTTASLMQNALAQLNNLQTVLTNANAALTSLGLSNIVALPTIATSVASVNAVAL